MMLTNALPQRFGDALGGVEQSLDELLQSPTMRWLAGGAIAEDQKDCGACAFVPYCGADPVSHALLQGDPDAPRHGSFFCERNLSTFQLIFGELCKRDPETMRTFYAWAFGKPRAEVTPGWIEQ